MNKRFGVTENGFERKRYEDLLVDIRRRAKQEFGEGINTSDSSPLGMFLKTIAWKDSEIWEQFEHAHYQSHLLYAEGFNLDMWASNFGDYRELGTRAKGKITIQGQQGRRVNKGFKVSAGTELVYRTLTDVVIGEDGNAIAEVEAMNVGSVYNIGINGVTQIVNPSLGVTRVFNHTDIKGGSDVETDEALRERLIKKMRTPLTGDNAAQYEVWAKSVSGVGAVRVLPITPKPGYVTVVVADVSGNEAEKELLDNVEEYIKGVKPVGAGVVVKSATKLPINIKVKVDLEKGANEFEVKASIQEDIKNYLESIALTQNIVSRAKIGNIIINHKEVNDYQDLYINDTLENVKLGDTEVPVLTTFNVEVI